MHIYIWSKTMEALGYSTSKPRGLSVIELMAVLALICILVLIAVPSFQNSMQNSRMTTLSDTLMRNLDYARMTALSQRVPVQVCPFSAAGSTACGSNWSVGFIVVTAPTTGTPTLLQAYNTSTQDPVLSVPNNVASVSFGTNGLASAQINFKLCDPRGGTFARSLVVMSSGFIQQGATLGQAVWDGGSLTCP